MLVLGQDEKAKYPFLADAGEYLKDKGFSLTQFGSDPVLKLSVEKALHRIKVAAAGEVYKSDLIDGQASKDYVLEREVFSFLLAIVLMAPIIIFYLSSGFKISLFVISSSA